MADAFFWGFLASSSLIVGALICSFISISHRTLGFIMAFGAGVLISAVAYELVYEAVVVAKFSGFPALGLFAGAFTFFFCDRLLDRKVSNENASGGASLAVPMVLAIILDGIPESAAIGIGLLNGEGVSFAMFVAVFMSNLPEAIAGTKGMTDGGLSMKKVQLLWLGIAIVCGIASAGGYVLLEGVSEEWMAFVQTFAAGAILTMLANSMIPEAYEYGKKLSGLFMVLGFAVSVGVVVLEHST